MRVLHPRIDYDGQGIAGSKSRRGGKSAGEGCPRRTERYVLPVYGLPERDQRHRPIKMLYTRAESMLSHPKRHETSEGPYGAKGAGELCSIPTSPAITNAIRHATGVRVRSLPIDQDSLFRAMKAGEEDVDLGWGDSEHVPQLLEWRMEEHTKKRMVQPV